MAKGVPDLYDIVFISFEKMLALTDAEKADYIRLSEIHHYKKGRHLVKAGQVCSRMYFFISGAVRGYSVRSHKDYSLWFEFDRCFVTSMASFVSQTPSHENIELLEDSTLISISHNNLLAIYSTHPRTNVIGRRLVEMAFIELEERTLAMQSLTATDRYEHLLERYPQFSQRVSLKHIASFLGISQETLSRIRSGK
ncbi:MAG TPA: Crp/Fnr family transcriptional regulator [Bacteroidota bacterium]|nr:Crp/Fnr family transcriptional regulator [Bacteroidota bacterium]